MAISETILFVVTIGITIVFSALGLVMEKSQKQLKLLAGLCWFISAIITFISGFTTGTVTYAISLLFAGFGIIFCIFAYQDFFSSKKGKIWEFDD